MNPTLWKTKNRGNLIVMECVLLELAIRSNVALISVRLLSPRVCC